MKNTTLKIAYTVTLAVLVAALSLPQSFAQSATLTADIKVNGSDSSITVHRGDSFTLTWNSTNASSCNVVNLIYANYRKSGTTSINVTNSYESTTYTLECENSAGSVVRDSVRVNLASSLSANITANGNDSSITVDEGDKVTIRWTSKDATTCSVSPSISNYRTSGSKIVTARQTETYTVSCEDANNNIREDSVRVNVRGDSSTSGGGYVTPAPGYNTGSFSVTLTASPSQINSNENSVLRWEGQNVASCFASGAWTGQKSTSGSQTIFPNTSGEYVITCQNGNVRVTDSVVVRVGDTPVAATPTPTPTPSQSQSDESFFGVRNTTVEEQGYREETKAQGLDNLNFRIVVEAEDVAMNQTRVRVALPDEIFFVPTTTKINGVAVADGIEQDGIIIGNIARGESAEVVFEGVVFYDVSEGEVRAQAIIDSSAGEKVNEVVIEIEQRGQVKGAAVVSTGPSNIMLWVILSAFLFAAMLYVVVYKLRFQGGSAIREAHLRAKIAAIRAREGSPDA